MEQSLHPCVAGVCLAGLHGVGTIGTGGGARDATPSHSINSFDPDSALGSSVDVLSRIDIAKTYSPHIVQESLSAGWGPITYRNNTELRMAAWHWTENGTWSDAAHQSGYFTGSTELKAPIRAILAMHCPIAVFATSGDRPLQSADLTYWKSNPYLTSKFTGESDALHPQWVVVDLKADKPVNAMRIAWASPYATAYQVEYWIGANPLDFDGGPKGEWKAFSSGIMTNAQGGVATLKLTDTPVSTRFLRVLLTQSSNTCDEHGADDVRNCVGYAIQQIAAGTTDAGGNFVEVSKSPGEARTTFCVSSIDPWHSAEDVNDSGSYQHSGFRYLLYQRPYQQSAGHGPGHHALWHAGGRGAQIAYIERRGYRIGYVEMARSPTASMRCRKTTAHCTCSGPQRSTKLILSSSWAPCLRRGQRGHSGVAERAGPDFEDGSFHKLSYRSGRLSDLAFVSFEHYPFEPCDIT